MDADEAAGGPGGVEPWLRRHPTLPEVVEKVGFGAGQAVAIAAACGVFFAEGLQLLVVCLLAPAVAEEIDEDGASRGFMISSVFFGALVGNLLSGMLADLVGRRLPILVAYVTTVLFAVVGSFMNSLWSVSAVLAVVGLGLGLGQPAAVALISELSPRRRQLESITHSSVFFGLGAAVAVLMVMCKDAWLDPSDGVQWRLSFRLAAGVVALLGFGSIFLLPESPSFLASVGEGAQARDVLEALRRRNGKPGVPVLFRSGEVLGRAPSLAGVLGDVLGPERRAGTLRLCFVALVQSFVLYGCGYAVPQALAWALPRDGDASVAPMTVLLLALVLAGTVLLAAAVACGRPTGSVKISINVCLALSSASALVFGTAVGQPDPAFATRLLLLLSCVGLCAGPAFCSLCLLQASASMFPAPACATGAALCLGLGRVGAAAAPLVADLVLRATGRWGGFFILCTLMEVAALLVVDSLPLPDWAHRAESSL